jgi:hypothetical protein
VLGFERFLNRYGEVKFLTSPVDEMLGLWFAER